MGGENHSDIYNFNTGLNMFKTSLSFLSMIIPTIGILRAIDTPGKEYIYPYVFWAGVGAILACEISIHTMTQAKEKNLLYILAILFLISILGVPLFIVTRLNMN